MTFLTTTAVKKLVVDLLKSLAKQTTNTLDDKSSSEQFYHDWCHLNNEGNLLVANAFVKIFTSDQ